MRVVSLFALVGVASGCWSEEPLVDDTFTAAEWEFLSTEFVLPAPDDCPVGADGTLTLGTRERCDAAAVFGQRLFFDPSLSGPILEADPFLPANAQPGDDGKIACASCHDPKAFFIDTRSKPGNISAGAKHTRHNAMSVVNTAYKSAVARAQCTAGDPAFCQSVYAWTGVYTDPGAVLNLAGGTAMNSKPGTMLRKICSNPSYVTAYQSIFGTAERICTAEAADDVAYVNLGVAFDAYTRRLQSSGSAFDRYVAGEHDALDTAQRRGLALFIGKAMCVECHRGPLLSDLRFHNTGVAQGPLVPQFDSGLGAAYPGHEGEFLTPPLRHVAKTAPYMHAGQFATLAQVVDQYRRGGDSTGFDGIKDSRIEPLEISDDEAQDLVRFLETLTGTEIPAALAGPPP
ncbi:MAG: cytochrome c peroxidase [Kofleriaceae bacterium]